MGSRPARLNPGQRSRQPGHVQMGLGVAQHGVQAGRGRPASQGQSQGVDRITALRRPGQMGQGLLRLAQGQAGPASATGGGQGIGPIGRRGLQTAGGPQQAAGSPLQRPAQAGHEQGLALQAQGLPALGPGPPRGRHLAHHFDLPHYLFSAPHQAVLGAHQFAPGRGRPTGRRAVIQAIFKLLLQVLGVK